MVGERQWGSRVKTWHGQDGAGKTIGLERQWGSRQQGLRHGADEMA